MSHDNQLPPDHTVEELTEMAKRIKNTKLLNDILAETKKAILAKLDYDEKNTPYDERPASWKELLDGIISKIVLDNEEIRMEDKNAWTDRIKERFNMTENEFLREQGRTIREGHEPTIDSGMEYMKAR